jgi:hypothetical protein
MQPNGFMNCHLLVVRSRTKLLGERMYRLRKEVEDSLIGRSSDTHKSLFSQFSEVPYRDFIVHRSWFTWTCVPVGFRATHPRHLAGVNFRKYLLDMSTRDGMEEFISQRTDGSWLLRTGAKDRAGDDYPPIHLCPPHHTAVLARCSCKATKDCSSCTCATAGRMCSHLCKCSVLCCTRQVPARPSGVICRCGDHRQLGPGAPPAQSLSAWAASRLAPELRWGAEEKTTYFSKRLRHAWRLWRHARHAKGPVGARRRRGIAMRFLQVFTEYRRRRRMKRPQAAVLYQRRLIAAPEGVPVDVGDCSKPPAILAAVAVPQAMPRPQRPVQAQYRRHARAPVPQPRLAAAEPSSESASASDSDAPSRGPVQQPGQHRPMLPPPGIDWISLARLIRR